MKFLAVLVLGFSALACAAEDGVNVGEASVFRNLVPAAQLEQQAAGDYQQLLRQAAAKHALAPADHPDVLRLRSIARRMTPFAERFNERSREWRWEVNLIGSKQVNAFCMPGGKIAFYSGILQRLELTDDEVAIVMGHEIAHALREHARERVGKNGAVAIGAALLGQFIGGGQYAGLFNQGGELLTLKFSRDDETEADVVGLELSARAGFDPRAGITLWEKMAKANQAAPLELFSTHPQSESRIEEIRQHLPEVMPLYERARKEQTVAIEPAKERTIAERPVAERTTKSKRKGD